MTSLGGVRSTMESRHRWEGDRIPQGLLRLSVGLEDVDEIWADLERRSRRPEAGEGTRTPGHALQEPLLYQLSYSGAGRKVRLREDRAPAWWFRIFRFTRCSALSIVFVSQPSSSAISSYDEPSR